MPYDKIHLQARIKLLKKRQLDLIPELRKRGEFVSTNSGLTTLLNDDNDTPKAKRVKNYANEIVTAWENEMEG